MTIGLFLKRVDDWLSVPVGNGEVTRLDLISSDGTKVVLGVVSFLTFLGIYGSWVMTSFLMSFIFIHEIGHMWAMRSVGMRETRFWFIPFFGGIVTGKMNESTTNWDRWIVAVTGPVWSTAYTLTAFAFYKGFHNRGWLFEDPLWYVDMEYTATRAATAIAVGKIVEITAVLNMVNLLPIPFLDGGRMVSELVRSRDKEKVNWALLVLLLGAVLAFIRFREYWALLFLLPFFIGVRVRPDPAATPIRRAEKLLGTVFHLMIFAILLIVFFVIYDEIRIWKQYASFHR